MVTTLAKQFLKSGLRAVGYEIRRRQPEAADAPATLRAPTYTDFVNWSLNQFVSYVERWNIRVILDVGGNSGQFGRDLRGVGFAGKIVSFEPLSAAHAELVRNAASDPGWTVAPRAAVGEARGEAEINIAGNSYSSSLLPMLEKHLNGAPQSAYTGREHCRVIALDDYLDESLPGDGPIGLKIDTQGFEGHVLRGLERHLPRVKVVTLEMSLSPMYDHAPSFDQLHCWLTERGLLNVGVYPEFIDPRTEELLQVNGVFARLPGTGC
ncbi:MAG: FkbM family methyltransferase [Planctomycetes bacterium]|nr:FkbM family methyltransferase [Planctomycetota bacterium]